MHCMGTQCFTDVETHRRRLRDRVCVAIGGRADLCAMSFFGFLGFCVWARWRCECYLCLWVGRSSVPLHVVARCLWHVVGGLSDFVELRLRRWEGAREPCVAAEARGRRFVCSFCCSQPFAIETVGCRPTVFAGAWPTPAGGAFITVMESLRRSWSQTTRCSERTLSGT